MDLYDDSVANLISSDDSKDDEDSLYSLSSPLKHSDVSDIHVMALEERYEHTKPLQSIRRRPQQLVQKNRKNYANLYKRKSVKWLNTKYKREKYRMYLRVSIKKAHATANNNAVQIEIHDENSEEQRADLTMKPAVDSDGSTRPATPDKDSAEDILEMQAAETATKPLASQASINDDPQIANNTSAFSIDDMKPPGASMVTVAEPQTPTEKPVAMSVETLKADTKEQPTACADKPPLYKQINEMFPKYDAILTEHVQAKPSNSTTAINEAVSALLLDIETLNSVLQAKELEWNRLLHLKKVKEELLARLMRQRHVRDELASAKTLGEAKCTIGELNELLANLADPSALTNRKASTSLNTAQQLVESRANMKTVDLVKERVNTKHLQSILVSNNILPNATDSKSMRLTGGNSNNEPVLSKCDTKYLLKNQYDNDMDLLNEYNEKQLLLHDILATRSLKKHNNSNNESTASSMQYESLSNAIAAKRPELSASVVHMQSDRANRSSINAYRLQCNDGSIIPVVSSDKLNVPKPQNTCNINNSRKLQNVYIDADDKEVLHNANSAAEVPICQECHSHDSQFVCGDCGNQWYCSRSCQISAWDKHSELCN